ncbi:MAG: hypothetical protein A2758_02360 [Candidatus Zambryskibacteria bacterium RIFCSPHIGHO2_01_FULL_49_18]|uniref:DUF5667 domain-containing protein n=2 Tax=Candidatus Zambryskiibacteriota TaxID=1817925 RepID=A0A1G2T1X9_9BACT|nr:MAG: hypothetical protein A2758_02360 [Candidatus Zambryskibacteria bacterium RIFCSPHIGHO2_01_FULL_49_18]OHB06166.1 MAG: hypothetical protein A3A26_01320 [Candidatus Zambryskibacteria bacterium RIFCSPLOWO2_01_FULL_47_14]
MKKPLEDKLKSLRFRSLAESEAHDAWNTINARITSHTFQLSAKRTNMISLLIGVLVFVSGGTAVAANSAVPGDVLFPIDRAVENMRLAFSGKSKANLKVKFAEERLDEVDKLIAKARLSAKATTTVSTSSPQSATTTPKRANGKVSVGVDYAVSFLNNVAADLAASGDVEASAKIDSVIDRFETLVNENEVKAFINTSGNKSRIEIRSDDGARIRVEVKDNGDIRVKTQADVTASSSVKVRDNDDDDNGNRVKGNATSTLKLELQLR